MLLASGFWAFLTLGLLLEAIVPRERVTGLGPDSRPCHRVTSHT